MFGFDSDTLLIIIVSVASLGTGWVFCSMKDELNRILENEYKGTERRRKKRPLE